MNESTALQDLNEFDLIEFDLYELDERLNSDMVLYTASCLLDDVSVPQWMKQKEYFNEKEANDALEWLIFEMNEIGSNHKNHVVYREIPLKVNVLSQKDDWIQVNEQVVVGQLILIDQNVFEVAELFDSWILVEEADEEDIKEMDLEGTISFDPLNSTIVVHEEIVEMASMPSMGNSTSQLSKSFEIQGFQVRISTSNDSLHIYASKKTKSDVPVFIQFDINEINCGFKWKKKEDEILASALKVNYETSLTSGFRTIDYEDRILDFSRIQKNQMISGLKEAFVKRSDCLEETIELCEIHLPFPDMPVCMLKMKVMLHIYASGKAEIAFESNHEIGFEKINDKFRWINDTEKESHVSLRASTKASGKLQFLLSVLSKDCMDVIAELGIQGVCETKLFQSNRLISLPEVSYEFAEEASKENDALKICADLDAYWLMNLHFNSNSTILGALGYQKTFQILDKSNASLFGKTVHLENFQIVEKCTRYEQSSNDLSINLNTDRIELKRYLFILEEGERELIEISGLPLGYDRKDLIYKSLDEQIASVSSSGRIQANMTGETIVQIVSKDGLYESQCSVFVK